MRFKTLRDLPDIEALEDAGYSADGLRRVLSRIQLQKPMRMSEFKKAPSSLDATHLEIGTVVFEGMYVARKTLWVSQKFAHD